MVSTEPHGFPNSFAHGEALGDGKNMICPPVAQPYGENSACCAQHRPWTNYQYVGAALSFLPEDWLDRLAWAPAWLGCVACLILWAILTEAMYSIFGANRK